MGVGWGTPKVTIMVTKPKQEVQFADPYKKCRECKGWVDGAKTGPGPLIVIPCEHTSDYEDLCPSWSPVDGCNCAEYNATHPENPIRHEMRPPADDGKVY